MYMDKLKKQFTFYSKEQKLILSKDNLNASIILFVFALGYGVVSLIGSITGHRPPYINGINTKYYSALVFFWALSGLLVNLLLKYNKKFSNMSTKRQIYHNNMVLYNNMAFYIVLTYAYMIGATDKVKPLMVFGIIYGVYTIVAKINPLILGIIYMATYIMNYYYIRTYLAQAEAILGFVYVGIFIICVYIRAYGSRNEFNGRKELERLNSYNYNKYVEALQINAEIQKNTILKLADLIESRDGDTGEHTKRTSEIVRAIAEELVRENVYKDILSDDYINMMTYSSMLHDVGKIKISDSILNAPRPLTNEEFKEIKKHTIYGKEIIADILFAEDAKADRVIAEDMTLYHHEKWDGTGYPYGLAGEDIPLHARIMAVADVYDALVSKRCYKQAYSFEKAMNIIREDSGKHFDPTVVHAFLNIGDKINKMYKE